MNAGRLQVGVDFVPVARVRALIETDGPLHRMLTPAETELSRLAAAWDVHGVAGRLAAKEAVFKLLRVPGRPLPWLSIEILKSPGKWPFVRLAEPASGWAADAGIEDIDISISHEEQFAFAVAVGAAKRPSAKEEFHAEHHLADR